MTRELLVFGQKNFKITIEDDDRVTFGPWSPPNDKTRYNTDGALRGTLRIYKGRSKEDVKAVFSGVTGYRDLSLDYAEEAIREEGAVVWKSDSKGYYKEEKVSKDSTWIDPVAPQLVSPEDADDNGDW